MPPNRPRPPGDNSVNDSLDSLDSLASQLTRGFQATQTLFQGLLNETQKRDVAIVEIRTELKLLRREVEALLKIVRDGNGQRPLVQRLATVESLLETLDTQLGEFEEGRETSRGHMVAIIVAIISLVASVGVPVIQYLLGN